MSLPLLHAGRTNPGLSAALDLRFALDKSLTAYRGPTPSFSRASTGSYFDGSGVLRYANVNVLLYSEQFENAYWDKTGNVTITSNQVTAPDGKLTADLLKPTASNTTHYLYRSSLTYSAGNNTLSLFVKYQNHRWVVMQYYDGGPQSKEASFDLLNGVSGAVSPGASSSIINVGNGWYRISITSSNASSSSTAFFTVALNQSDSASIQSWSATGTESVAIWGAQVETGSTVGTYCPTTSSANSAPRFNHTFNGTSWVSKGLLVEEQRTNICLQSSGFSTASWAKYRGTVTANAATSPDGTGNASNFTQSTGQTVLAFLQQYATTTATQFTLSVFAKANGKNFIVFTESLSSAGERYTFFNVSAGSIGTSNALHTARIVNVGNGWYRCSVTFTALAKNDYFGFNIGDADNSFTCTDSGSVLFYGAMLEAGSFSTSHIETTSASTTRSADVCQITGSDFSGFWNGTEGSIAAEYDLYSPSVGSAQGESFLWQIDDGTNNNRIVVAGTSGSGASNKNRYAIIIGASPQVFIDNQVIPANVSVYSSAAWKLNDAAFYSGSNGLFDTSTAIPTGQSNLRIGQRTGDYYLNGHISRLRYFNKRLPNATLQLLSEPDPTLNLQFALNKTLTPVAGPAPSFSRASTGTFFNASGVLTSASINTPRFDHVYSGGQWVSRGLLLEEQRTNNCYFSNTFSNAAWEKYDSSISSSGTGPDGNTSSLLTENTANGPHWLRQQTSASVASGAGVSVTASIFVKANGRSVVGFGFDNSFAFTGKSVRGRFDLSDGSFANEYNCDSYSVTNVGNGWYRLSVTSTAVQAGIARFDFFLYNSDTSGGITYMGDGSSGVYVFGAQIEQGAFPTSYTGTTSSSVTRSADVCQITGTSFNWMWNQGEGSVVAEFDRSMAGSVTSDSMIYIAAGTGAPSNIQNGAYITSGNITTYGYDSAFTYNFNHGSQLANTVYKVATAIKLNDFASSLNGLAVLTDNSGTVGTNERLLIGHLDWSGGNRLNGHIAKLIYYPARLTNTKLQQLST